jgi:CheY-like chemotaxis protein
MKGATMSTSLTGNESARPSALVVEDEPLIGEYLAETLDDLGFEASAVCTYAEALAVTKLHGRFTVAFVDLALPDRSGLELISELRTQQPDLPIVIASGYGAMAAKDVNDHYRPPVVLCKPYDGKVVAAALLQLGIDVPHTPGKDPHNNIDSLG